MLLAGCSGNTAERNENEVTGTGQPTNAEKPEEGTRPEDETTGPEEGTRLEDETAGTEDETLETVNNNEDEGEGEEMKRNEEKETGAISDKIPVEYYTSMYRDCGKLELVSYTTKDYFGDGAEITKPAYVYLPFGYDESKQYNVLYLMHGIGGNEKEWGMYSTSSRVKSIMDKLIKNGLIEPFIVVTPNGRSCADYANTSADFNSFYKFGEELRNDLIPFIESKYSTYADVESDGNDFSKSRDHRAMAGLSMGGMQTINIGMCECLDIISWFGAFSAAPTSYPASKIVDILGNFPDEKINYFYNICGTEDKIAYPSASAAAKNITGLTERLIDGTNYTWQELPGGHDFNIWYLGFYNFARIAFKNAE